MPISPMPTAVSPAAFASRTVSMPTEMACTASLRSMAGFCAKFSVPCRIFRSRTAGQCVSVKIPTSVTITSSPKNRASVDMPVRPRVMLTACSRVTDCGAQLTPSAQTPLSAAKTSTPVRPSVGRSVPKMPARRTEMSSSRPRLWGGLASWACRASAAHIAAASAGVMVFKSSKSCCSVMGLPFSKPAVRLQILQRRQNVLIF